MTRHPLRIRFQKLAALRFLSHHDLARAFERLARRAAIPLKWTEGFHPSPRASFALALPLGAVGLDELLELEMTEAIEPEVLLSRLTLHAPPGLVFKSCDEAPTKKAARPVLASYRITPAERLPADAEIRLALFLDSDEHWIGRRKPEPKMIDLRPYVRSAGVEGGVLVFDVWVTPNGTARPDELAAVAGLFDASRSGALIERTRLVLADEIPEGEPAGPGRPARPSRPWSDPEPALAGVGDDAPRTFDWGASPNGPVVE